MQDKEFYGPVQEAGHLDATDRARTATEAVLDPLFEGVTIDREKA